MLAGTSPGGWDGILRHGLQTAHLHLCGAHDTIERLQRASEHIEEVSPEVQEQFAAIIEENTEPLEGGSDSLAGSMPDLPDNMVETLLRMRREAPPTPTMDEQLNWLDDE